MPGRVRQARLERLVAVLRRSVNGGTFTNTGLPLTVSPSTCSRVRKSWMVGLAATYSYAGLAAQVVTTVVGVAVGDLRSRSAARTGEAPGALASREPGRTAAPAVKLAGDEVLILHAAEEREDRARVAGRGRLRVELRLRRPDGRRARSRRSTRSMRARLDVAVPLLRAVVAPRRRSCRRRSGSRFDVAAAAPAASRAEMPASAVCRPETSESGSLALKYWPCPFTAACQRSSMRA